MVFANCLGKIRGMMDSTFESIKEAGPSSPVIVWGLSTVPSVGEKILSFKDEKEAKNFIASLDNRVQSEISTFQTFADTSSISGLETKKKLNLIIKTDSQGSSEAINSVLSKLDSFDVQVRVLYSCEPIS